MKKIFIIHLFIFFILITIVKVVSLCHEKTNTLQVMEYKQTDIKGVFIIEPRVFQDARGYFFEAWKDEEFQQ